FFFQAEDGIRDRNVTGVQTCALPILNGNKMRAFLLDLSFLGWRILNLFTLGILRFVWINPYTETVWAEVYAVLRAEAIRQGYSKIGRASCRERGERGEVVVAVQKKDA